MTETVLPASQFEIDVDDVEYRRDGSKVLLARVYRPRGEGPFPAVVEVHGGAWCDMDRLADAAVDEPLAQKGVVVVAIDFRMPPEASYPASLADINYAIRWVKSRAGELGTRAELVGVMGNSSGGHQAALAALRPHDPRYCALALPRDAPSVDAEVRYAVLVAPVIDPLGRYHYAKALGKDEVLLPQPDGPSLSLPDAVLSRHDLYWQTEEAMSEGSPLRALERGEQVALPPMFCVQGSLDRAHPREQLERFVARYREAGGEVQLEIPENEKWGFLFNEPDSPAAAETIEKIRDFIHRHTQ
jgi:acetyl esterase/lipase